MSAHEDFFRSKKAAAVLKHGILSTGPDTPTLFDDALVFDARKHVASKAPSWIALIKQNLALLLDEGQPFKPADRVPEVYGSTLGQASATHVGSAIKEMHASGLVSNTGTGDFWKTPLHRP